MNPIGGGDGNNNNNNNNNNNANAANVGDLDDVFAFLEGMEPLDLGDAEEFGGGFEHGGGVNIPLLPVDSTVYLLSLVRESLWLRTHELRTLLTRRDLPLTYDEPFIPDVPSLHMLPAGHFANGRLADGFLWRVERPYNLVINGVTVINARYAIDDIYHVPRLCRRIYRLVGQPDVVLVHYKVFNPATDLTH